MSRVRSFADADTTLWEKSATANTGYSPILELNAIFNGITDKKEWARILARFNISAATGSIVSSKTIPDPRVDNSVSAYLYLFNARHGDEQATSFNVDVFPLSADWNEGTGLDNDKLSETGYANAVSAKSTAAWTTSGGDYRVDSLSATQSFDNGEEDLRVNITDLFNAWLAGTSANYGVILKLSDANESKVGSASAVSVMHKRFYGRETNTCRAPYIQLEWPGQIEDFRNFVEFGNTANLFFYNIKNGQLVDLNGSGPFPGNVTLSGLSGASYSAISTDIVASRHGKGIYKANLTMPLTANEYSAFKDNWFLSASPTANYTFDFSTINPSSGFDDYVTTKYKVNLKNLRTNYERGTISRIRMHINDDSLVLAPMTAATTAISNFIVTDGTYEIRELNTDLVEQNAVQLSFDQNGNFFELNTNNLCRGIDYKAVFKLVIRGETLWYDDPDHYQFKVR